MSDTRLITVLHRQYPSAEQRQEIIAQVEAMCQPWETLSWPTHGDYWGSTSVTYKATLIYPSNQWCGECGFDVRPDEYGRTYPFALYIKRVGADREYALRNRSHTEAHLHADSLRAEGHRVSVSIDSCG